MWSPKNWWVSVSSAIGISLALGVWGLLLAATGSSAGHIITWGGNASEWNRLLGVNAVRMGCSSAPASCVRSAERLARSQDVDTVYLAIRLNAARAEDDASAYSRLSLGSPILHEVGFDDFVSQCQRQEIPFFSLSSVLAGFARELKSENPGLRLGITLYMDQIASRRFPISALPHEFREGVDFVHLYPHYRREDQSFAAAVDGVHAVFTNAEVIAGIYAYDRRDYLPCARDSSARCSNDEELTLFASSLRERMDMLRSGRISAIEFYPGGFGLERQWSGWKNPRSCQAGRRSECIANTLAMRRVVREALDAQREGWSANQRTSPK